MKTFSKIFFSTILLLVVKFSISQNINNRLPTPEVDIIEAKVLFIDTSSHYNSEYGGTFYSKIPDSDNSLILLEIYTSDSICYPYMVIPYDDNQLQVYNVYKLRIKKVRSSRKESIVWKDGDSTYKRQVNTLPKVVLCNHEVLRNPKNDLYYYIIDSVYSTPIPIGQ